MAGALVPTRSWSAFADAYRDTAVFVLCGPLFDGQIISHLEFMTTVSGTATVQVGAVATEANTASLDAWRSGRPLLDRSDVNGDGQPVMSFFMLGGRALSVALPVGVRVTNGPTYVVGRFVHSSSTVDGRTLMGVVCVGEGRVSAVNGSE